MKKIIFSWLCCWVIFYTQAQTDPLTQVHGAKSQGLGNLRVQGLDIWSVFNNIGALDRLEHGGIAVGFDQRYNLKELNTYNLAAATKTSRGTLGLSISRFGGKLFNQQTFGLGFSNTLGITSIGVKMEWFQTQIEGFGSSGTPVISLGGISELSPNFFIGAHITNLGRSKISKLSESRLPTAIQLGVRYRPAPSVNLYGEVEKDILQDPVIKVGVAYNFQKWLHLRTGINSNPSKLFLGFGLLHENFAFDYSRGQNQALGSTNHFSLSYLFR